MTIKKGEPWGESVPAPDGLHVVHGDPVAGEWVAHHRRSGRPVPAVGLASGDLARTMGGGAPGRFSGSVTRAPVDAVRVTAGGDTTWAVAHVVARRSWWRGEVVLVMNAQFLRTLDVAPRSHPNDGRVDSIRVDPAMSMRARLQARRRARTGTHLPHPGLNARSGETFRWDFARPLVIWVDGVRWSTASSLEVVVEPDAFVAYS